MTFDRRLPRWAALWLTLALTSAMADDSVVDGRVADDLTALPLEHLMATEVVSASRLARQVSDSPSAVAIVTADDIRAYGYRTLADVINSMRGLYTTWDRRYAYLGGRGFGKPGDYTGRIMLLVDGYATQDNLYNQAYIDHSGLVDLELVERVEYVPGTGSVTYGNNALLGIINVVTKKGSDIGGVQLSADGASYGTGKGRATFGKRFENGANLLVSYSSLYSEGQNLYFPGNDSPADNHGRAEGIDSERGQRVFGKLEYGGLTLEGAFSRRKKEVPSGLFSYAKFNAPYQVWDDNGFLSARYERELLLDLRSATHVYHGFYADNAFREFDAAQLDPGDPERYRRNRNRGRWWGIDQKFVANWWADHDLVFGLEYRHDYTQRIYREYLTADYDVNSTAGAEYSRTIYSVYLADEYSLHPDWKLNLGGRYDKVSDFAGNLSPRVALIYTPTRDTTLKASYSEAFRAPNADDLYSYETVAKPEHVKAMELVLQQQFGSQTRLTGSVYRYLLSHQTWYDDELGDYVNTGSSQTRGVELELEKVWTGGIRLRTSAAYQEAMDVDHRPLINSPHMLGKANFTFPFWADRLRAGLEAQYLGPRLTEERRWERDTTLANLTLSTERKWHGLSASFSIRNLFDERWNAVSPLVRTSPGGAVQDVLRMDGRNYWLQLTVDF